ncbi:MAG: hypothetical protein JKY93_12235 [Gammaproteobacteria bacterium]|nr:hypothetical protein [Gammaproteobacteria bacterium]
MIKVLLYVSLLFASGISAGEGMLSVGDFQLAQQFGSSDQVDGSKNIDTDDPEVSVDRQISGLLKKIPSIAVDQLTISNPQDNLSSNPIRAPPFSS